jgi:hypothetical protein
MGKRYVQPGEVVEQQLPWSEVCMSMRVADQTMRVQVTDGAYPMAQLEREDGSPFSFPITLGEAGLYQDAAGIYQVTETPARALQVVA